MDKVIARALTGGSACVGRVNNETQSCHEFKGGLLQKTSFQQFVLRVLKISVYFRECPHR